jgi:hypothetical protein
MKPIFVQTFHFSETIGRIDERISQFEDKNLTKKVVKVQYLGTINIGDNQFISSFLIWSRFSLIKSIKNLHKILGIFR